MPSIKDVAKEAGVAPSTVSLVLNNKGYVSDKTRKKVELAIDKLNYIPSEVARNLSLNRTKTIGVVVPSISHPFFAELLESLETELYKLDYKMMLCCTKFKENYEAAFIEMLKRKTMDGIIMAAHHLEVKIEENLNYPIVAFDCYINNNIPIINSNHSLGGELAAKILLKHNCKFVIDIAGHQATPSPSNEGHQNFCRVMCENGVKCEMLEMDWNALHYQDYLKMAENLFKKYPKVDGIFGTDVAILSCMNVASNLGIKIPQDLKLLSYDGTNLTKIGMSNLTTIRQPIEELAKIAVQKIINKINNIDDDLPLILDPYLIEGETC